jgi:uncharacterized protein YqkB
MRNVLLALLFIPAGVYAQFTYVVDQSIPVFKNDVELTMPWAGGLNASQLNTIDLNNDGIPDLAIFDRTANKVVTFLTINNQYHYAPEFETLFPEDVTSWMLLKDFNCDGRKDLFTRDPLGIKVYMNVTPVGGNLQWEHFLFYSQVSGMKFPVILTKGFSSKGNLQINTGDLPAFVDADGDGDLDIFNPRFPGGATIEYHKNFSMERYGTCDSLDFERITTTWGNVTECECGEFAFDEPCNSSGRVEHTGGKSLQVFDVDGDGDHDVFFSEENCTVISLLRNDGNNTTPVVTTASIFPEVNPIFIQSYPAIFFEDVDFDGVNDLIASPNFSIHNASNLNTALNESIWFYRNTGSNSAPIFSFQRRNFLQNQMIDEGDNAVPAFFDADGDGDFDMFIGYYANGFRGSIAYYENTGTQGSPVFTHITSDFIGLSFQNLVNVRPHFADINGDTKVDLIFTASTVQQLFQGQATIFYILNNNGIGLNFSGQQLKSLAIDNLNLLTSENILLVDADDDNRIDLLVGRQNGSLEFWKNTGSASSPNFTLRNNAYLGIGASTSRQNMSLSVGDLNHDRKDDLVFGNQKGFITIIGNYKKSELQDATENIIYSSLLDTYTTRNLGGVVWPTVVNLFKTDNPSIVVGNTLGGLQLLRHDESAALPDKPQIDIFPNPVSSSGTEKIKVRLDRPAILYIHTSLGQEVGEPLFFQAFQEYDFSPPNSEKGILIFRFIINGKSYIRRLVVL